MTHENHAFWVKRGLFGAHGLCSEIPNYRLGEGGIREERGGGGKGEKSANCVHPAGMRMLVPLGLDCLHCSAFREQVSAARALTYLSTNLKRIISLFIVSF